MKQILLFIIPLLTFFTMKAQETTKIKITAGNATFTATLQDNEAANAFEAMLPLTLNMAELNGNEKYGSLPGRLPMNASNPGTIQNGDLMLYGSSTLVVFYKTFSTSYSYTKIGKIDNPAELENALGTGSITIKFEGMQSTKVDDVQSNKISIRQTSDGFLLLNEQVSNISLIDMNGRIVAKSATHQLFIGAIPSGIYVLKVENNTGIHTQKIKI